MYFVLESTTTMHIPTKRAAKGAAAAIAVAKLNYGLIKGSSQN